MCLCVCVFISQQFKLLNKIIIIMWELELEPKLLHLNLFFQVQKTYLMPMEFKSPGWRKRYLYSTFRYDWLKDGHLNYLQDPFFFMNYLILSLRTFWWFFSWVVLNNVLKCIIFHSTSGLPFFFQKIHLMTWTYRFSLNSMTHLIYQIKSWQVELHREKRSKVE